MITIEPKYSEEQLTRARNILYRRSCIAEKKACEASFAQFVKCAWHVIQPMVEIRWNWHHDYLCDMLQGAMERIGNKQPRRYRYRITNICPSSTKSYLFTRMSNAWCWTKWPWIRFISSSYANDLSFEHSGDTRMIIKSDWYQNYWGDVFSLLKHRDSVTHFENDKGGMRAATSTGSKVTGRHAHIIINDDPLSAEMAESDQERMVATRFCIRTLDSRLLENGEFWYVMQRLHEEDPTGYLLKKHPSECLHICIPAEIRDWVRPVSLKEKYKDGLFFPDFPEFSKGELAAKKKRDPLYYACQYLQMPYQEEGGMFKRKNWIFWRPRGSDPLDYPPVEFNVDNKIVRCDVVERPVSFLDEINTWDFSFKDQVDNDPVAGFNLAEYGQITFVMDREYGVMSYADSCDGLVKLNSKHPLVSNTLIEDKANGSAIIQDYQKQIRGIRPVQATKNDNPHTRAVVTSRYQKNRQIALPHPKIHPWALDVVDEHTMYRNHKISVNDQVASISQGVVFLKNFHPVFPSFKYRPVKIKIDWRNIDYSVYSLFISQWVESDSSSSIVIAAHNQNTRRLAFIGEFILSSNEPRIIKPVIITLITRYTGGMITKIARFTWIGSPNMFGRKTTEANFTRASLMRDGMWEAYSRDGINLTDNIAFEEAGAILHMNKMILDNSVLFDEKAAETGRQCSAWSYEGDSPAKAGFGCARAAINVVNFLQESGKMKKPERVIPAYSEKREKLVDKFIQAEHIGTIDNLIGTKPETQKDGNSWMLL